MSTSGTSKNILKAIIAAKKKGIKVIFVTSNILKKKPSFCDVLMKVPALRVDRIQEMHIAIGHIICELIEKNLK
jgi:D-sedoheptulose 7-phosphate isomerase